MMCSTLTISSNMFFICLLKCSTVLGSLSEKLNIFHILGHVEEKKNCSNFVCLEIAWKFLEYLVWRLWIFLFNLNSIKWKRNETLEPYDVCYCFILDNQLQLEVAKVNQSEILDIARHNFLDSQTKTALWNEIIKTNLKILNKYFI